MLNTEPPSVNKKKFVDHLDSIIKQLNLNNNLFVFGDLNMNWLNYQGVPLKQFADDINLSNFVTDPMRVITTKTCDSSTLIDVLLHNKNSID